MLAGPALVQLTSQCPALPPALSEDEAAQHGHRSVNSSKRHIILQQCVPNCTVLHKRCQTGWAHTCIGCQASCMQLLTVRKAMLLKMSVTNMSALTTIACAC